VVAVAPALIERYVTPGRLRIVFRAVLNHGEWSERASEAAACAGRQGRFWPMHGILFERQRDLWGPGLVETLVGLAREVPGLDSGALRQCLVERATLPALKAADAEQRRRGIHVQPVFEVGGRRFVGLQSLETLTQAIEFELP
jgi:protein-disulfide isomerase